MNDGGPPSAPGSEEPRWTILVVPDRGSTRQYVVHGKHARAAGLSLALMVAVVGLGLWGFVDRWMMRDSEQRLLDENLALKARLQDIQGSMDEVEDLLRRLRLYEAQLDGLDAGTGPLDAEEDRIRRGGMPSTETSSEAMEEPGGADLGAGYDVGEDVLWAGLLASRVDRTLAWSGTIGPEFESLVARGEALRGRLTSLPHGWPVDGGVLSSGFGYRRSPFTHRWKFHSGVDIAADPGTPIHALARGRVLRTGFDGGYGRMIEIDHGHGVLSRCAHTSSILVNPGDVVEAGQTIATVGSTGMSTGPHLHYELDLDGVHVDPLEYLSQP